MHRSQEGFERQHAGAAHQSENLHRQRCEGREIEETETALKYPTHRVVPIRFERRAPKQRGHSTQQATVTREERVGRFRYEREPGYVGV